MFVVAIISAFMVIVSSMIVISNQINLSRNLDARKEFLTSKPLLLAAAAYISIIGRVFIFAAMLIAAILRFKDKNQTHKGIGVLWITGSLLGSALIILSTVYWYNRISIGTMGVRAVSVIVDVMVPIIIGLVFTVLIIICAGLGIASDSKQLKNAVAEMNYLQQGYPQQNITDNSTPPPKDERSYAV